MTPKTALLHIGTPKTGTTSIQACLAHAETAGSLRPYRYPLWRADLDHRKLSWLYRSYTQLPAHLRVGFHEKEHEKEREAYRRFFFCELRSAPGVILSWEGLSHHLAPSNIAQLRQDLESAGFGRFHIVLYVRDPADKYLSVTSELLKSPYFNEPVQNPVSFRYKFRDAAEAWEEVFPGSLIVRPYPTDPDRDVVDDFAAQLRTLLGITLPKLPTRLNATLSAEAMQVIHDYRQAIADDGGVIPVAGLATLVSLLQRSTQDVAQNKPALKESVAVQIRENHQEDGEFLHSRYGVDLGLRNVRPPTGPARMVAEQRYSPATILDVIDSNTVQELALRFADFEPDCGPAPRPLPLRAAARAYRAIPPRYLSAPLDDWLRSRFGKGASG